MFLLFSHRNCNTSISLIGRGGGISTWPETMRTWPKAVHIRENALQTWPKAVHICAKAVHILRLLTRQPFGSVNGGFVGITVGVCLGARRDFFCEPPQKHWVHRCHGDLLKSRASETQGMSTCSKNAPRGILRGMTTPGHEMSLEECSAGSAPGSSSSPPLSMRRRFERGISADLPTVRAIMR